MKSLTSILIIMIFLFMLALSINYSYAQEIQEITVEIKYTNGDRADHNEMKILVYKDFEKTPIIEKELINNPDKISVEKNHKYKIEVFVNGMYAGVGYVELGNESEHVEIGIPLSGGLKFDVYYNDGETPINRVTVVIKSQDNVEWRKGVTNIKGETLRYWIQSTTNQNDYYIADVFLGDVFLKSQFPIKLQPGISTDQKIITNIPKIVENLISISLFDSDHSKISLDDGTHKVTLVNLLEGESVQKEVNFRGDAQFSNLKSGAYEVKVSSNNMAEDKLWPTTNIQILGTQNEFNIFKIKQELPTESVDNAPQEIETCNCVAFRFDDVQDYWLNDVQIEFMNTFVKKEIPVTVGIIADSFGDDVKMLDFINNQKNKKYLKIASHGLGNTPFTEFSKEEQNNKIIESFNKIKEKLDVETKVFIPPQNRFNEETKQVLIENGYTHISSSLLHGDSPPYPLTDQILYRFPEISTTGMYEPQENIFVGIPHEETFEQTISGLGEFGYAVITSHPQEFSHVVNGTYTNSVNEQQILELEKLIENIQQQGIKIVPLDEINSNLIVIVPEWVKNNAGWWADGSIDDKTFVQGIEFLVKERIIKVSEKSQTPSSEKIIPEWIKNNAGWWADGSIDDKTFVQGIEFLVKERIITY